MNWSQLKTILWLRWRLTRNQSARSGGLGAVIAIIVTVGAFILGGSSFIGGIIAGALGLGEVSPMVILGVWFGLTAIFLLFWTFGLIAELQRSESIDLQRLMHLPVVLGQIFIINYAVSHIALSIILFVPAMMGLTFGLAYSRGAAMLLMLPLALAMVFMITAWTYCLRGWLATLMSNPRRRRSIIVGITLVFVLLAQGPNLYFNLIRRMDSPRKQGNTTPAEAKSQRETRDAANQAMLNRALAAQKFIPPLWVPLGAQGLAEHRVGPALLGAFGCAVIGGLGLRRAYRGTVRFYHGETGGLAGAKENSPVSVSASVATKPGKANGGMVSLRLPGVPEQAAAVALATLRSMLRAPEVKMAWATSFIVMAVVGGSFMMRRNLGVPETVKPFLATGSVALSLFMMFQFLCNQFGLDRDGFRALVLSPADRRQFLLGKNLASLPMGTFSGITLLTLVSVGLHLPLLTALASVFQLMAMFIIATLVGNLLSILTPFQVQAGSMKPTKLPALALITMIFSQLLFPIALTPVFVAPLGELLWRTAGGSIYVPVNLILSTLMAGLAVLLYSQMLGHLGRLLHRREIKILDAVTAVVQ